MPLSDAKIRSLPSEIRPGKVADFDGLFLLVKVSGSKSPVRHLPALAGGALTPDSNKKKISAKHTCEGGQFGGTSANVRR